MEPEPKHSNGFNFKMETELKAYDISKRFHETCLVDQLYRELEEKIEREQQRLKESKKKTEVDTKFAQQKKLNIELNERLAKFKEHETELDKVCASIGKLTIKETDKNRLQNAQDKCELVKKLTDTRLDFSAPQHIAKGYVKNESQKLLLPFEIDMSGGDASEALWDVVQSVVAPGGWPLTADKENRPHNR